MTSEESRPPAMQLRLFGRTGLAITPLGFGAWAIGGSTGEGERAYGWGAQDEAESIAAIRRAVEHGVNWIDTAPTYGFGRSEEVIGKALRGLHEPPFVFTKCGVLWDEKGTITRSLQASSIRRQVEASLRRLGLDTIDLYQIHTPLPDEEIEEGWAALAELKAEGKVRHIGVSNFSVTQLRRANAIAPVETLQPPYSLVNRSVEEEILPFCKDEGIGVIVYSPLASGLLSGAMTAERVAKMPPDDWRRVRNVEFQEPQLSRNLELVERLRELGARLGRSSGEIAVAWTLRHPAVTGAIVGFRRPEQVDSLIAAAQLVLSGSDLAEIESVRPSETGRSRD